MLVPSDRSLIIASGLKVKRPKRSHESAVTPCPSAGLHDQRHNTKINSAPHSSHVGFPRTHQITTIRTSSLCCRWIHRFRNDFRLGWRLDQRQSLSRRICCVVRRHLYARNYNSMSTAMRHEVNTAFMPYVGAAWLCPSLAQPQPRCFSPPTDTFASVQY